jgi:hypothetical protein
MWCYLGKVQFYQSWQRGTMVNDGNITTVENATFVLGGQKELCTKAEGNVVLSSRKFGKDCGLAAVLKVIVVVVCHMSQYVEVYKGDSCISHDEDLV